ncbi:uncharacterized protein METZ01_LOCUS189462, partial [marine metagenome]
VLQQQREVFFSLAVLIAQIGHKDPAGLQLAMNIKNTVIANYLGSFRFCTQETRVFPA